MVSARCKMMVRGKLEKLKLHFVVVDLREVEIIEDITEEQRHQLKTALLNSGLELMDDKSGLLVERIDCVWRTEQGSRKCYCIS